MPNEFEVADSFFAEADQRVNLESALSEADALFFADTPENKMADSNALERERYIERKWSNENYLRKRYEAVPEAIRPVAHGLAEAGGSLVSMFKRAFSSKEDADQSVRNLDMMERGFAEANKSNEVMPEWLAEGVSGVTSTLSKGAIAAGNAPISGGIFALDAFNKAITHAEDQGKSGGSALAYAAAEGVVNFAMAFMPGVGPTVAKTVTKSSLGMAAKAFAKEAAKGAGINVGIGFSSALNSYMHGINGEKLDVDSATKIVANSIRDAVLFAGVSKVKEFARSNPDVAKSLASKASLSRKDAESIGMPRTSAEERSSLHELLKQTVVSDDQANTTSDFSFPTRRVEIPEGTNSNPADIGVKAFDGLGNYRAARGDTSPISNKSPVNRADRRASLEQVPESAPIHPVEKVARLAAELKRPPTVDDVINAGIASTPDEAAFLIKTAERENQSIAQRPEQQRPLDAAREFASRVGRTPYKNELVEAGIAKDRTDAGRLIDLLSEGQYPDGWLERYQGKSDVSGEAPDIRSQRLRDYADHKPPAFLKGMFDEESATPQLEPQQGTPTVSSRIEQNRDGRRAQVDGQNAEPAHPVDLVLELKERLGRTPTKNEVVDAGITGNREDAGFLIRKAVEDSLRNGTAQESSKEELVSMGAAFDLKLRGKSKDAMLSALSDAVEAALDKKYDHPKQFGKPFATGRIEMPKDSMPMDLKSVTLGEYSGKDETPVTIPAGQAKEVSPTSDNLESMKYDELVKIGSGLGLRLRGKRRDSAIEAIKTAREAKAEIVTEPIGPPAVAPKAETAKSEPPVLKPNQGKTPVFAPEPTRLSDKIIAKLDDIEQQAKKRLREKGLRVNAMPVDALADVAIIGAAKIAKGGVKFAQWSADMVNDFGDDIKPDLKKLWNASFAINRRMNDADWNGDIQGTAAMATKAYVKGNALKKNARPDLANPDMSVDGRNLVDQVDIGRSERGQPERRKDSEVFEKVNKRLAEDYEGEKARVVKLMDEGSLRLDEDVVAAKAIIRREGAAAIASGDPVKIKAQQELIAKYRNTGSEAGRNLRQRHDDLLTPEGRADMLVEEILTPPDGMPQSKWEKELQKIRKYLLENGINIDDIEELVKDPDKVVLTLNQIHAAKADNWDALYEFRLSAMMSAANTQSSNLAGNTGQLVYNMPIKRPVEVLTNMLFGSAKGAQAGELKYLAKGIMPGIERAWKNAFKTWHLERPAFEASLGRTSMFESLDQGPAITGKKGRVIRAPLRLSAAVDSAFKSIVAEMEVGARAYRIAKAEKLSGSKLEKRIAELVADTTSKAWDEAVNAAMEATYADRNKLGAFVARIKNKKVEDAGDRFAKEGTRHALPFVITPLSVFRHGVKATPLGSAMFVPEIVEAVRTKDMSKVSKRAAEQAIAWGATVALYGAMTGDDRKITGSKDTKNPYAIRVGDTWYSYKYAEPFATILGTMADMAYSHSQGKTGDKMLLDSVRGLYAQAKEKTFTKGIAEVARAIEDIGGGNGTGGTAATYATNLAGSFIPAILKSPIRASQENSTAYKVWGGDAGTLGKMSAKRLGASVGIGENPYRYDVWGRPLQNSQTYVNPIKPSKDNRTKADRLIEAWNAKNPDAPFDIPLPRPSYRGADGKTKFMSDERFAEFQEYAGQLAHKRVEDALKNVKELTPARLDWIRHLVADSRKWARLKLLKDAKDSD
jgi:hypothetical protein